MVHQMFTYDSQAQQQNDSKIIVMSGYYMVVCLMKLLCTEMRIAEMWVTPSIQIR